MHPGSDDCDILIAQLEALAPIFAALGSSNAAATPPLLTLPPAALIRASFASASRRVRAQVLTKSAQLVDMTRMCTRIMMQVQQASDSANGARLRLQREIRNRIDDILALLPDPAQSTG
jgi:hypothetical protein